MTDPALQKFKDIVTGADENINLVQAALVIASNEYPELDTTAYLDRLALMAGELRERAAGYTDPIDIIEIINEYLFDELGFSGNLTRFNDPRNSFLNDVLDRKTGIPLTLSLVYMELGNRIGLTVRGISFPGHFLVKVVCEDNDDLVLDPFSRGLILDDHELEGRLEHFSQARRSGWQLQKLLEPAGSRDILLRLLRNLKNIYFEAEDFEHALEMVNFMLVLAPSDLGEIRDRAYIHDQLDCFRAAIDDYHHYLMLSPEAHDASYIQSRLADLKQSAERLH
jgi:regulator of sirC expression with transglutaminase-like and TPR domain